MPGMAVDYERRGAAALITINRPERRNAVDGPTAAALLEAYERFAADDGARVLVLTGAGDDAFCAGADLKALETLDPDAPAGPMGFTRRTPAKPAIAAIGGWCVAGGLELALWCDLRVAGATARFGCLERRWGVPLIDGGTQRLPRVVGLGRALDLILTGRTVEADEALAMGLVNDVVAPGGHVARALELAETIAAFPQETMLSDREAAHAAHGLPIDQGLALEARLGRGRITGALEGARRFSVRP
jgi:enoyl-CoA hydratase